MYQCQSQYFYKLTKPGKTNYKYFYNNNKIMDPKDIEVIAKVKIKLTTVFEMVNIRLISFYLGLKIKQDSENMIIKLF